MGTDADPRFREETVRVWVLRLVTEVRADGLHVRLAPLQGSFRHVPAAAIAGVASTTYAAGRYAGWHWGLRRTPGGHVVYRLRGDRGVEVTRADGTRWFVGSTRPDELATALGAVAADA